MCVIGKANDNHTLCQSPSPSSPPRATFGEAELGRLARSAMSPRLGKAVRPAMSFLSGAKDLARRTLVKNRNEIPILLAQNCPPGSTAGLRPPLRMTERGRLSPQKRR